MQLDELTLLFAGVVASAFAGLFLLGAWVQQRSTPALMWWACAHMSYALAKSLIIAGISLTQPLLIMIGAGITGLMPLLVYSGVRSFVNRRNPLMLLAIVPAIWLAIALAPLDIDQQRWATLIAFSTWCIILPFAILDL